mmetsp:Transcript_6577/g.12370  ORF Transcript_6577/g.12370 Transcript_6577/m.12370 type:complete len:444 (-) Transcript_6577:2384-3715(-)
MGHSGGEADGRGLVHVWRTQGHGHVAHRVNIGGDVDESARDDRAHALGCQHVGEATSGNVLQEPGLGNLCRATGHVDELERHDGQVIPHRVRHFVARDTPNDQAQRGAEVLGGEHVQVPVKGQREVVAVAQVARERVDELPPDADGVWQDIELEVVAHRAQEVRGREMRVGPFHEVLVDGDGDVDVVAPPNREADVVVVDDDVAVAVGEGLPQEPILVHTNLRIGICAGCRDIVVKRNAERGAGVVVMRRQLHRSTKRRVHSNDAQLSLGLCWCGRCGRSSRAGCCSCRCRCLGRGLCPCPRGGKCPRKRRGVRWRPGGGRCGSSGTRGGSGCGRGSSARCGGCSGVCGDNRPGSGARCRGSAGRGVSARTCAGGCSRACVCCSARAGGRARSRGAGRRCGGGGGRGARRRGAGWCVRGNDSWGARTCGSRCGSRRGSRRVRS